MIPTEVRADSSEGWKVDCTMVEAVKIERCFQIHFVISQTR